MGESNLRRKKPHGKNQGSNFLGDSFSSRDNLRALVLFRRKSQSSPLRADPLIFTSVAPVLLDWWNKTSWIFAALKSTSHFLLQYTVSRRSDSNLETNTSCYHRSDTWSHLQGLTIRITIESPYVITYLRQNFGLRK